MACRITYTIIKSCKIVQVRHASVQMQNAITATFRIIIYYIRFRKSTKLKKKQKKSFEDSLRKKYKICIENVKKRREPHVKVVTPCDFIIINVSVS